MDWLGATGERTGIRPAGDGVSRRALLRQGGNVGVGALLGAAGFSIGATSGAGNSSSSAAGAVPGSAPGDVEGVLNVLDHGAVGDGRTDDTAAIQAALDAVGPQGGTVFFPVGTFAISATLTVRTHNTALVGAGPGQRTGTTHKAVGTRLTAVSSLDDGPMLRVQLDGNDEPVHGVTLRGLSFDGAGTASGAGVHFRSYRGLIDHVFVYDFLGHGFEFQGYPHWDIYDTVVAFSQASGCGGSGLFLADGATDMHFTSCIVYDNQDNMQFSGGGSAQVTGCHFYSAGRHDVLFNGAGSRSKFANCKIEGAGANGVLIDSTHGSYSDIQFTGCNFASNGRIGENLYDHFAISGPPDQGVHRTVISGCSFSTKSGTPVARYFIGLGPNARQTVIVGNSFGPAGHYGTGIIDDGAPDAFPSVIRANGGLASTDIALIHDTVRAALVAGPNITITPDKSTQTMTISSCPTVRTVTADTTLEARDGLVRVKSEFDVQVTVPADSTAAVPVGTVMRVRRQGNGEVFLAAEPGVTLTGGDRRVDHFASYTLIKVYADTWDVES